MTLFLFIAAQMFSAREKIPLTAISIYSSGARSGSGKRRRPAVRPRRERVVSLFHGVPVFGGHPLQQRQQSYFWGNAF